jgi:hypothetical protein
VICNLLGDLALNAKDIRQVAVIGIGPKMGAGAGIDELGVDSNAIGDALHASFCDVSYT